jgi:FAD:protein FMN transferase
LAWAQAEMERVDRRFSLWRADSAISRYRLGESIDHRAAAEIDVVLDRCRRARELSGGWFDPWALAGGVDPTGLVKGWAARRAPGLLVSSCAGAMVNAGGDIAVAGPSPSGGSWRVGIRHPQDPLRLLGLVQAEAAVATSGLYERGAHVVDPRRGRAATDVVAATVTGAELDLADAFATALVAAGTDAADVAARLIPAGYESLVVTGSGELSPTPGFPWAE